MRVKIIKKTHYVGEITIRGYSTALAEVFAQRVLPSCFNFQGEEHNPRHPTYIFRHAYKLNASQHFEPESPWSQKWN